MPPVNCYLPPRPAATRIVFANACLLAGFLCLCWVLGTSLARLLHERYAEQAFDLEVAAATPAVVQIPAPKETSPAIGKGRPLARLSIARLGVFGFVEEGFDARTLSRGIGLRPNGPRPGEPGNIVLAAHRDTHFAGLKNARIGDKILIQTRDGRTYPYAISRLFVVKPSDEWVLHSSPGSNMLTLITCYPFRFVGSAPNRFVVQAEPLRAAVAEEKRRPALPKAKPVKRSNKQKKEIES